MNTAAPAVRNSYSATWFDNSVSVGLAFPGAFTHSDFDNHGDDPSLPAQHASAGDFLDLNLGCTLQFGALGVSATGDLQQYSLTSPTPGRAGLTLQIGRWRAIGAYGMFGGQLAVGGGARIATMQILQSGGPTLVTMTGAAPEVGALLMPTGRPWRIGVTARAPVTGGSGLFSENATRDASGVLRAGDFVLPSRVVLPWEVEAGVAYQVGPRPLNPGWQNPHEQEAPLRTRIESDRTARQREYDEELARLPPEGRPARRAEQAREEKSLRAIEDDHLDEESERLRKIRVARYENWPREKILLLASVLMTGPTSNAVSVEGFLDQRAETVGQNASFTPRLGLEGEPLQNRMLLRTGTYLEPSRYDGGTARQHFTFGADIRLFPLDFWGLLPEANWKLGLFADSGAAIHQLGAGDRELALERARRGAGRCRGRRRRGTPARRTRTHAERPRTRGGRPRRWWRAVARRRRAGGRVRTAGGAHTPGGGGAILRWSRRHAGRACGRPGAVARVRRAGSR